MPTKLLNTVFLILHLHLHLCPRATAIPQPALQSATLPQSASHHLLARDLPLPNLPASTVSLAIDTFFPAGAPVTTYFATPLAATITPLDHAGLALDHYSGWLALVASDAGAGTTESLEVSVSGTQAAGQGFGIVFDQPFPVQDELFQTTVGARVVSAGGLDGDGGGCAVSATLVRIDVAGGAAVRILASL